MTNNYYILYHLANYLKKNLYKNSIREIYSQEKNKIIISFGENSLEFSAERNLPYLVMRGNLERARKNTATLFGTLTGETVTDAGLYNDDRIISISLSGGSRMLFSLIPAKMNLLIVPDGSSINESFKKTYSTTIEEYFKSKIYPRKKYSAIGEFISGNYPKIDRKLRSEIINANHINILENLNEDNKTEIQKIFSDAENRLLTENFRIYEDENDIRTVIEGMEFTKEFENVNLMLLYYIRQNIVKDNTVRIKENLLGGLQEKINNAEKKINNLRRQLVELELNEDLMIKGNLILSNLEGIKNYTASVRLKDPDSGIEYEIKLDSRKSAIENAQNYFRKYKKGKEALTLIESKIEYYENQRYEMQRKSDEINSLEDYKSIKKMDKENIKDKQAGETDSLFRKFRIDEQFEIWTGKDSRSNDLLTTKYASQNDLWFHIRGFSGSHTILKRHSKDAPVPKEFIEYAASIAAYYSKARNAGTVPVAYCEKKYVKKQKGFKEGTVTMEKEKIVYVKPVIPEYFQKFLSRS